MCQYTDRKPFNWHIVELVYWHIIKKQPAYKPGPVPLWKEVPAIYLVLPSPVSFSGLPPGIGRAILHAPVYMTLQPIRRTASRIATGPGELLPHLFTLTGRVRRLFSVTLLYPHGQLPVKKYGALCCPDFPHTRR